MVIAGSRELPGAAKLAAVAGLRAGCGKLQIATARSISVPLGIAVPEARVIGCEETEDGCLAASAIEPLLGLAKGAQATLIGCGMQHGPPLEALLDALLDSGLDKPLVLDAAVLGCLAPRAETLRAWQGGRFSCRIRARCPAARRRGGGSEADPLPRRRAAERSARGGDQGRFSYLVAPYGRTFRSRGGVGPPRHFGSGECSPESSAALGPR